MTLKEFKELTRNFPEDALVISVDVNPKKITSEGVTKSYEAVGVEYQQGFIFLAHNSDMDDNNENDIYLN